MTDEHPIPGRWQWWGSYDGGEHMTVGPAESRDELIQMLLDDRIGEYQAKDGSWRIKAEISECQENHVDLARFFDVDFFLERAAEEMDENECGGDEDGERHPVEQISKEQERDLEARVRAAIRQWQKDHGLKLRSYWFVDTRNSETVDLPLTE